MQSRHGMARRRGRAPGFTLLEVLLVLVIVGLLAGLVLIGFTDAGVRQQVQTEAERLSLAVELARTEALMRNEIWGLALQDDGYGFKRNDPQQGWVQVERRPFAARTLEPGLSLRLRTASGRDRQRRGPRMYVIGAPREDDGFDEVVPEDRAQDDEEEPPPAVAFYPGGDATPFRVIVAADADVSDWIAGTDGVQRMRTAAAGLWEEDDADLLSSLNWRR